MSSGASTGGPVRVHAVVPLRSLEGKTRLGSALSAAQRAELVRVMAAHVIDTVSTAPGVERVHLLTREPDLAPRNCSRLADPGGGLNAAIAAAAREVRALGAERMLIVHADLPFLTREEIDALVLALADDALVAAPDRAEAGTNALGFSLARPIATCFGPGSLLAHRLVAEDAQLSFRLVRSAGLACDIDEPAQLEALRERGGAPYAFLSSPRRNP
ncbi:MAG TPA: 2-phospho-L-lactate guanylyltransferase [Steroidobacteraceae bacterium]|nr:2-phospho-L-lactate guanylyltransferase [Steroidobacteraceae bacterium]